MYEGQWKNNKWNGQGTYNGKKIHEGEFEDGSVVAVKNAHKDVITRIVILN